MLRRIGLFAIALVALVPFARSRAVAEGASILAVAERTVVEVGRTRVIAFRVAQPTADDIAPETAVGDAAKLEIARPAAALKGETLGWIRVRGLAEGETTLTIGDATMAITVVKARQAAPRSKPELAGPADGAVVWGTLAVGMEVDAEASGPDAVHRLVLGNGDEVKPDRESSPVWGPTLRLLFKVKTKDLEDGPLSIVPVTTRADGRVLKGDAVTVHVVREFGAVDMEAEGQQDAERPERFGKEQKANIGGDPRASGDEFASMYGADPAVCFPVEAKKDGWYAVMATVKGSFAGGAWPTVGLIIDNAFEASTNGATLDGRWHRIALGVPVRLSAGKHTLTPYFMNDFYAPTVPQDRNFFLDRIEVLRMEKPPEGGGSSGGGMMMGGGGGGGPDRVRVAFQDAMEGRTLHGVTEINGACWWRGMQGKLPAPKTTLMVNGKAHSSQRSAAPKFWLNPGWLEEGENTIQLVAEGAGGGTACSTAQTVKWRGPTAGAEPRKAAFHRWTVRDAAWDGEVRKVWSEAEGPPEKISAFYGSNGKATLKLPEDVAGRFYVFVEGRGWDYQGPSDAKVTLEIGKEKKVLNTIHMPGWWSPTLVGVADIPAGAKKLVVEFVNDLYEKDKGDRNMGIISVIFSETDGELDKTAPSARIAYPPEGHEIWQADAVVAEAADWNALAWVELVIDGERTGIRCETTGQSRAIVLPLTARNLAAGEHELQILASDSLGNEGWSKPRTVRILAKAPAEPGRYERAVHLLNRFAYGPDPDELAQLLLLGENAWMSHALNGADPGDDAALNLAAVMFANEEGDYDVMARDAQHAITTTNPVRTRFVRWTDNHFNTWIRKVQAALEMKERAQFTRLGIAAFPDLLRASSESPAMLQYLDQTQSFSRSLNENYAREIMELHTLGVHGGYTQADVTALACLLTGWTYGYEGDSRSAGFFLRRLPFRFDPALSDGDPRTFLGMRFPRTAVADRYDRSKLAIELLLAHPSTATFICGKLVEHYCGKPADAKATEELAKIYAETYGDLRAVLAALAKHPAFWRTMGSDRVTPPFDYATRLSRVCGFQLPWQVLDLCSKCGAGLFDRATPDGYQEEDAAWVSTNATLQRWRFARNCEWALATVVPATWRWGGEPLTADTIQVMIDVVALRMTGRLLGEKSNAAALELLAGMKGTRDDVSIVCATFVASCPEANCK